MESRLKFSGLNVRTTCKLFRSRPVAVVILMWLCLVEANVRRGAENNQGMSLGYLCYCIYTNVTLLLLFPRGDSAKRGTCYCYTST